MTGWNRYLVIGLLVLATVSTTMTVLAVWANRQALNTDDWTDTSTRLLENPDVRATVADFLVEQLYAHVDIGAQFQRILPPDLDPFAGPAAAGLRDLAVRGAEELLSTGPVEAAWKEANRAAHQELLDILFDRSTAVLVSGDTVTLNLGELVSQVGRRLGVSEEVIQRIPPGTARVDVLRSDQVRLARSVAQGLQGLTSLLTILSVGLYVAAIALASGRRRETMRNAGIGLILAGAVVLVIRDVAGNSVVDALSRTAAVERAADDVWRIGTSLLVLAAQSVIVYGLLLVVGAWLAGPTQPAVAVRRLAAPFTNDRPAVAYGGALVVFAFIAIWAPTPSLTSPLGLLILALLLALGAEILRRQVAHEFPEEPAVNLKPHVDRVRTGAQGLVEWATSRRVQRREGDTLARLERLAALHRDGILTDAEVEAQKALILRGIEPL
jgi:hypothetical protein